MQLYKLYYPVNFIAKFIYTIDTELFLWLSKKTLYEKIVLPYTFKRCNFFFLR